VSEGLVRAVGVALALIGAAISSYLLYARHADATILCSTGGCSTVQSSRYAEMFGVPVAALGLIAFVSLALAAALPGELARDAQAVLALGAAAFGGYLLYVQLVVIEAVCDWCLATDALVSCLAVLALLRLRASSSSAASDRERPDARYAAADEA
jgi:uncharacterized membrane protein